eukprot:7597448-Lingulodinium_polyedra.AAC.1
MSGTAPMGLQHNNRNSIPGGPPWLGKTRHWCKTNHKGTGIYPKGATHKDAPKNDSSATKSCGPNHVTYIVAKLAT